MADIARLELALRNADAAGDTEAARVLAQAIMQAQAQAPEPAAPKAPAPRQPLLSGIERFTAGLADPVHGGAQLLTKALPDSVVKAGNAANNWLADKTGLVARLPEGGVDEAVRQREAQYQAGREPDAGVDWLRLAGNVASPTNLAFGGLAGMAAKASLPMRMVASAGAGGLAGSLAPVTSGDFADEKGAQMFTGAAFGAFTPVAMATASRVLSPRASVNPDVKLLRAEGIRPTIGQTLGGWANRVEEKTTSLPIVGDKVRDARRIATEDLNVAAANRALAPLGKKAPEGLVGRDLVEATQSELSKAYNTLLPKLTVKADSAFDAEIRSLRQMVATGSIDPNSSALFNRILQNDLLGKFRGQKALTGETMKAVESDLGVKIGQLGGSTDADARLVASALSEVRDALRSMVERNNPAHAKELKAINAGWANYKRLERATASLGADEGVFTAAQLQSAVKALDRSKDKKMFSHGKALMQDLSDPAKRVLGAKVPDSGTAGRIMNLPNMLAANIGYSINPMTLAAPAIGYGMYSKPAQALLRGAVSSRPDFAEPIAGLLNRASPMLAPAGGLLGVEAIE